jgi:hypothetical protein
VNSCTSSLGMSREMAVQALEEAKESLLAGMA